VLDTRSIEYRLDLEIAGRGALLKLTLYVCVGGGGDPPLDLARDLLKMSAFKATCASKYLLKAIHVCLTV
jgi:hypothetical protein